MPVGGHCIHHENTGLLAECSEMTLSVLGLGLRLGLSNVFYVNVEGWGGGER